MSADSLLHQRHAAIRERLLRSDHVRAGRGSISWTVNREAIVVAGWGRAILLQMAHPAIAAGVGDHSAFGRSLIAGLRRLRSTVRAMLAVTFGDAEAMAATASRIHAVHDRVRGAGSNGRVAYSAHDPALQRWVHVTVVDSTLQAYERLVGPLAQGDRDRYCAEAAGVMEPLLNMPAGWLPRNSTELDACMTAMLTGGSLVVGDTGRALARAVLYPPHWYLAWPAFRAMQVLTLGSLPPAIRQAYGFEWRARDARSFARWATVLRVSRRLLPPIAREWPAARNHRRRQRS